MHSNFCNLTTQLHNHHFDIFTFKAAFQRVLGDKVT